MTLNTQPAFPSAGGYVLKLRLDSPPDPGRLCGRLEHIATGETLDFASPEALLAGLLRHAGQVYAATFPATQPAGSAP